MPGNGMQSVFEHAPQMKAILFTMFAGSCAFNFVLSKYQTMLIVNYESVFINHNVLGFLLSRIVSLRINDIVFFCYVLYNFKVFEQRMGLSKFANLLFATSVLTMFGELALIYSSNKLFPNLSNEFPIGPLGIIFPLAVYYYKDIQKGSDLYGGVLTSKVFIYSALFHISTKSIAANIYMVLGLTIGAAYRNISMLRSFLTLPKILMPMVNFLESKLSGKKDKEVFKVIDPMGATLDLQRQDNMDALERRINNRFGVVENVAQTTTAQPREEQINSIVAMGFNDREQIKRALMSNNNDTTRAINQLLAH